MSKFVLRTVFSVFILLFNTFPTFAEEIAGTFVGIDDAEGMAVWIKPDPAGRDLFSGRILAKNKAIYDFTGERSGNIVQGAAVAGNQNVFLHITYKSVGIVVNWIPILTLATENAPAQTGDAIEYVFVREGTFLPQMPGYFAPPPKSERTSMNTLVFLDSYQFWPPAAVSHGFAIIPSNHRALLRFYPHVQTDILWKLCKAGGLSPQRQRTIKGQGVGCPDIIEAVDAMQQYGSFSRYKKTVAIEKEEFRMAVGCGQGMLQSSTCKKIAKGTAQRALELKNVRSILNGYLQ